VVPFDGGAVLTMREEVAHGSTRLLGKRLRIGRHGNCGIVSLLPCGLKTLPVHGC
jgi:hypothetical protein